MCKPTDRRRGCHGPHYFLPIHEQLRSVLIIPQEVHSAGNSWTDRKAYRIVHHDYHDHSKDNCANLDLPKPVTKGGVAHQFPVQLHGILDTIEEDGHEDVMSWQPHGRCFLVHQPKVFLKEIMPRYFKQRKFASFQRQLNLYGFQRLTTGRDKGGYYHELFLRNKPVLAQRIKRQRIKGTGVRPRSNPEEEPDFYKMPSCFAENDVPDAELCYIFEKEKDVPMEVTSSEEKSRSSSSSSSAPLMDPVDEDEDEEMPRSPSPAVADHRTATEKLCSSFQPEPTTSSNVVPFIVTSCSKSELNRPESSDDDDNADVVIFEGKPFHFLNLSAPLQRPIVRSATPEVEEPEVEEGVVDKQLDAILGALGQPLSNLDNMDELAFGIVLENLLLQRS